MQMSSIEELESLDVKPDLKTLELIPSQEIQAAFLDDLIQPSSSLLSTPTIKNNDIPNSIHNILEVRCGKLIGKLHLEHFLCPGIHQNCIQIEGEVKMISPKEFTIRADKDRQKDWKGSIKLGRFSLRYLMEHELFEFYNHKDSCSSKCQSRNYLKSISQDPNSVIKKLETPKASNLMRTKRLSTFESVQLVKETGIDEIIKDNVARLNTTYDCGASTSTQMSEFPIIQRVVENQKKEEKKEFSKKIDIKSLKRKLVTDPLDFWIKINEFKLADSIIDEMVNNLTLKRNELRNGPTEYIAQSLSKSITALGLSENVGEILRRHKSIVEDSQTMTNKSVKNEKRQAIEDEMRKLIESIKNPKIEKRGKWTAKN